MAEIIQEKMSIYEKLQILTDAAKYDVASQLFCGWKVYFTSEDFIYERVYL